MNMISCLYIESEVMNHPRARAVMNRFEHVPHIEIERYGELFNRKSQNFRLQKQHPALILAHKHGKRVLPAPEGYGIGGKHNYYFSHMMNCIYDCRYCFLQGMYRSANYVLFVNYEDFVEDIDWVSRQHPGEDVYFYSGYDCDSLALEPVSRFVEHLLPYFQQHRDAYLELRTKSTQIRPLLDRNALNNVIVAFSFTPHAVSDAIEHKVPSVGKRIEAMLKLQAQGWPVGLRFDPLIYFEGFEQAYTELFTALFSKLDICKLHSVSLGVMRLPSAYFDKMQKLYADEKLFAINLRDNGKMVSYSRPVETRLVEYCEQELLRYIPRQIYYPCVVN